MCTMQHVCICVTSPASKEDIDRIRPHIRLRKAEQASVPVPEAFLRVDCVHTWAAPLACVCDCRGACLLCYADAAGVRAPQSGQQAFARMINEPDAQGCTPLHYASRHGHIRCLQRLMDLGACPNVKDANNESPLHFAARSVRRGTRGAGMGWTVEKPHAGWSRPKLTWMNPPGALRPGLTPIYNLGLTNRGLLTRQLT